jgi:hypothetical protein
MFQAIMPLLMNVVFRGLTDLVSKGIRGLAASMNVVSREAQQS